MGLMKKLTSVVVTAGLLLGLVGTAAAAYPDGVAAAAGRMHDLGLVNGKVQGSSDLQLNDPITRAELVTIIVRAFGKANDAKFLKGAAAFPDTASHWASGEIALAKNMIEANGFSMGMPDGTFAPDAKLTTAQAVAFVMKFLGAPRDASQAWPNDYLNGAVAAGLMSADDKAALEAVANNDANRGLAFYLADEAFYSYKMADGKTVYTEFVKPTAPTVTLDEVAPTTKATATVSGSVSSDATAVYVGSMANQVTVTAGKFSADVDLTMGDNNISVMATDLAGNTTTKTLTITRTVGAAASIDAPATLTVKAGDTVDLAAAVKDADGNTISDAVLTATGDAGTLADGKFTAATKAGSYTLTLTSGDLTASVAVTVTAADIASIAVTPATVNLAAGAVQKFAAAGVDQYGNSVDLSNVSWTASAGVIDQSGNFAGTGAGNITVTATSGESSGTATATVYGAAAALKVSVAGNLLANNTSSTTTATLTAVDANGNPVPNATNVVTLTSSNSSVFTVSPAQIALVNGTATVTLTSAATSGATAFLSATAANLTGGNATVTAQAQTLGSVVLSADPAALGVGNTNHGRIKVSLMDTNGVAMKAPVQIQVQLTSGTPTVASFTGSNTVSVGIGSKYNYTDATAFTAGNVPGSTTVSGVVITSGYTNLPVTSATVSTSAISTAYKLSMDPISAVTVDNGNSNVAAAKVRILDYNGNQVTSFNSANAVTFVDVSGDAQLSTSSSMSSPATNSISVNVVNGAATLYLTDMYAETLDIQAYATSLGSVTGQATFNADMPTKVVSYAAAPTAIANDYGVSQSAMKFKIADKFGNVVTNSAASVTLVLGSNSQNVTTAATLTQNASGGYVTFNVKSTGSIGYDYYYAKSAGLTDSLSQPVQVQNVGSPFQVAVYSMYSDAGTKTAPTSLTWTSGSSYSVKVGVYDQAGKLVSSDNGRTVNLSVTVGTATVEVPSATTVNGVASFTVDAQKSGSVQLSASSSGLQVNTVQTTNWPVNVAAGWPVKLLLSASSTTLANDGLSNVPITVYTADDYGNYSAPKSNMPVTLTMDSTTAGGFGSPVTSTSVANMVTTSASANATASYYSTGVVGTGTITATAAGYQSATLTMTTSSVGAAVRLAMGAMTDKSVDTLVGDKNAAAPNTNLGIGTASHDSWLSDSNLRSARIQKVTVSVVDNAGLQVTNNAGNQEIDFRPSSNVWVFEPDADYSTGASNPANWRYVGPTTPDANGQATYVDSRLPAQVGGVANPDLGHVITGLTAAYGSKDFYVISPTSGALTYTATAPGTAYLAVTGSGNFLNGVPTWVKAQGTPATIAANGTSQSLIRVYVTDDNGNTVTSWNGTATLTITGPADLQSNTVNLASGVGSVYITSRAQVGTATVTPSIAGIANFSAASVQVGSQAAIAGTATSNSYTIYGTNGSLPSISGKAGPFDLTAVPTYRFVASVTNAPAPALPAVAVTSAAIVANAGTATGASKDATTGLNITGGARYVTVQLNGGTATLLTLPATNYADTAAVKAANTGLAAILNAAAHTAGIDGQVTFSVGGVDPNFQIVATTTKKGSAQSVLLVGDALLGLNSVTQNNHATDSVADLSAVTATELAGLFTANADLQASATAGANGVLTISAKAGHEGTGQTLTINANAGEDLTKLFTSAAPSAIGLASNNKFKYTFNGTSATVTIGALTADTAANAVTAINTALGAGAPIQAVENTDHSITIQAKYAGGYTLSIDDVANNCYSMFGFTANTSVTGN